VEVSLHTYWSHRFNIFVGLILGVHGWKPVPCT